MQDFTLPDMIKYASTNFEENQGFKELENEHPAFSKRLVKEIAEKASGVFLWVVLVVKSLLLGLTNGDEIEDLQKRLDDLPSDLEDLFQKIFDDIEPSYRLQASKLLQLFRAFFHPPTILSLAFAEYPDIEDALEYPVKELTNQEMISKIERTRRRLNSRCRGLLEVPYHNFNEDSRVSYLHRTVKDFVEVKKRWDMIVAFGPPSFEPYGHIAKSNLMQVKTMTESRVPKHFISCTRNCADYASAIPETLRDLAFQIFEELESCLSKINKKTMQSVATHGGLIRGINFNGSLPEGMDAKDVPKIESFLHYTILDGYQWYVKEKMERLIDVRQPDLMPLQFLAAIAIFSDSTSNKLDPIQFIQFMLDHGCDPNETFNGETLKLYSSIWVSKPWVTATQSTKIKALHNLLEKYGGTIVVKSAESQISRSRHDHSGAIRNAPKLGMVDTKPPGELGPGTERTKSFSLRTLCKSNASDNLTSLIKLVSKRRRQRTT
jgi:hypothetical protein